MKPVYEVENGKLIASVDLSKSVDADADGRVALEVSAPVTIKIDLYEALNEVSKKDSALLDAVLAQLNYKKV